MAREGSHKEWRVPGMPLDCCREFMEGMQCWCGLQNDMRNLFFAAREPPYRSEHHVTNLGGRKHVKSEIRSTTIKLRQARQLIMEHRILNVRLENHNGFFVHSEISLSNIQRNGE